VNSNKKQGNQANLFLIWEVMAIP